MPCFREAVPVRAWPERRLERLAPALLSQCLEAKTARKLCRSVPKPTRA